MEKEKLNEKSIEFLSKGINNLDRHIYNLKKQFGLNVVVAINKYEQDTEEEIQFLKNALEKQNVELSLVEAWAKGGEGATDLAQKVVQLCKNKNQFNYIYDKKDSIKEN